MMMQTSNTLTDAEFFALHPQPALSSCVYQPRLEKESIPEKESSLIMPQDECDALTPDGAPDLSEYSISEEDMRTASRRLYELTTEVRQAQGNYAPLGPPYEEKTK